MKEYLKSLTAEIDRHLLTLKVSKMSLEDRLAYEKAVTKLSVMYDLISRFIN